MLQDVVPPQQPRSRPKTIEPSQKTTLPEPPEPVSADEPVFEPPEAAAAKDMATAHAVVPAEQKTPETTKGLKRWLRLPHGRTQWSVTVAVLIVVLGGGGATAWALTHHQKPAPAPAKRAITIKKVVPPAPIYSDLSGLQIADASLNKKPVTAVMVENSIDARPQSGLSQAGVVFEAQAEGGVTRFMALYQDTTPTNVGPIRSARPYYIQWALGFDAAYAHVGGSPDALADIGTWNVQDMNQFYNGNYYHRISSRAAPHNVYTGIDTLNGLESQKGYTSTFTGFPRATVQTPLAQPAATSIDLAVSGPVYNPHYDYNAATNSYNRSTEGTPDTDANTGKQISPTVVIAMVVPLSQGALDSSGAYYSNYNVLGSGTTYIFQNGGVTTGQWHKASAAGELTFTDASGNALPLNRGQAWITAVANTTQISYKGAPAAAPAK
jgi:hypothetical protein